MASTHAAGLGLLLALLAPAGARADAVGFPMDCPAGTTGDGCHGAEFCRPQTCARDSECAAGLRCIDVGFCVRSKSCFSRDGTGTPVTDHYQLCETGPCPEGGCEPSRVCATPPAIPRDAGRRRDSGAGDAGSGRSHAKYGCGCEVPAASRSPLVPLTLLGLALGVVAIVLARRRR